MEKKIKEEKPRLLYEDVFAEQIWGFFCDDMESCFEVSKNKQELKEKSPFKGGLNFMATLVILSVIDFCAAFYHGKSVKRSEIAVFMNKYFSKYNDVFSSIDKCKKFYDVFRHGLSHQWSPKWAGIAMDFNSKELILKDGITLILNTPEFYEIVISGLRDYEADLDNCRELRDKFSARHDEIFKNDLICIHSFKEALNNK